MIQVIGLRKFKGTVTHVHLRQPPILAASVEELFLDPSIIDAIPEAERWNIYFTAAHHRDPGERVPSRSAQAFQSQDILAWDIDGIDNQDELITNFPKYQDAVLRALNLRAGEVNFTATGHGMQIVVFPNRSIVKTEEFAKLKPYWLLVAERIQDKLREVGLDSCYFDPVIFDPARILRFPGTGFLNRKEGLPDAMVHVLDAPTKRCDFDLMECAGIGDLDKDYVTPREISKVYPLPDYNEMVQERGCKFIHWALNSPEQVHEPQAFDLFSILAPIPDSEVTTFDGKEYTPQELGQYVFDRATSSRSLAGTQFDKKWEQAKNYGGRRCSKIASNWVDGTGVGCSGCPWNGKIPTPLAIKSKDHIASESNGFWVFSPKGLPLHPNYEDLYRAYRRDKHYMIDAETERMYTFDGRMYTVTPQLTVKGWVDTVVNPTDPLREAHRNEFLHKIKSNQLITPEQRDKIFIDSIVGKINLRNGVVDVVNGNLLEHSPTYGFKYILPYAYQPEKKSEFFLDWLDTISMGRPEVMEAMLDIMGYCFIPGYPDHVFAVLTGTGNNGKSTFIKLIGALLGKSNYTAISLNQLTANRFMPALLDGKLANVSSELGDVNLSAMQLETLKLLSGGDELAVENKGETGYMLKSSAKLIFSMNKSPSFAEDGVAMKRRLMVIPFDYKIEMSQENASIGDRLCGEELEGIFSILLSHIQERMKANGGVYKVRRHSDTLMEAQRKVLATGNTSIMWADEYLTSSTYYSSTDVVVVDEAFAKYRQWAEENCLKNPASKPYFSRSIKTSFLVPEAIKINDRPRLGDGSRRYVFPMCKWKD